MSLWIDQSKVTAILLADGWHDVEDFSIDAYEFGSGSIDVPRERSVYDDGAGFCATERISVNRLTATELLAGASAPPKPSERLTGPMSSILAIRESR